MLEEDDRAHSVVIWKFEPDSMESKNIAIIGCDVVLLKKEALSIHNTLYWFYLFS
jgi:hypothetical protein